MRAKQGEKPPANNPLKRRAKQKPIAGSMRLTPDRWAKVERLGIGWLNMAIDSAEEAPPVDLLKVQLKELRSQAVEAKRVLVVASALLRIDFSDEAKQTANVAKLESRAAADTLKKWMIMQSDHSSPA